MVPMMLLLALGLPLALSAQFVTPYDPQGNFRNWAIKGKVLPLVLGEESGIGGLIGAEYGFTRNQSIGIDGFIELTSKSDENAVDTAGVTHGVARYYHSRERAFFLNYRYYFGYKNLRVDRGIIPYALVFLRYGKIDQHYDPLYPLTSFLDDYETHYSVGLMGGSIFQLSHTGRLGVDVNMGFFVKQKNISAVYLVRNERSTLTSKPLGPGFRFAANMVYWFDIRRKG